MICVYSALCLAGLPLSFFEGDGDVEEGRLPDLSMAMPTAVRPARDLPALLILCALFFTFKLLRELFNERFVRPYF